MSALGENTFFASFQVNRRLRRLPTLKRFCAKRCATTRSSRKRRPKKSRRSAAQLSHGKKFAPCSNTSEAQANRDLAGLGKIAPRPRRDFARLHISTTAEICAQ